MMAGGEQGHIISYSRQITTKFFFVVVDYYYYYYHHYQVAKYDTDPHMWMPLTLEKDAYIRIMKQKVIKIFNEDVIKPHTHPFLYMLE